jgi:hypothetical protein
MTSPRFLYFAHDLDDAAIWRRVGMLEAGGAVGTVVGFRRRTGPLPRKDALVLGRTKDGRMLRRAGSVLRLSVRILARLRRAGLLAGPAPDVIIARNLEMLILARIAVMGISPAPRLVYELLDIHRLQSSPDAVGRLIRFIEARLLRACDLVLISSPGFKRNYLEKWKFPVRASLLVENRVFDPNGDLAKVVKANVARSGPVEPDRITIGWFGILRCQWSLDTLDALTRAAPGRYRIILRGKPALDAMPNFDACIAANPDMTFKGPYRWPDDLSDIYLHCDLAWLIDRFDATGNSRWLLPNRLYEGCLFGAVPIAIAASEVGRTLKTLKCGIILPQDTLDAVTEGLGCLDQDQISEARDKVTALPITLWKTDNRECRALVDHLCGDRTVPTAETVKKHEVQVSK